MIGCDGTVITRLIASKTRVVPSKEAAYTSPGITRCIDTDMACEHCGEVSINVEGHYSIVPCGGKVPHF